MAQMIIDKFFCTQGSCIHKSCVTLVVSLVNIHTL